MHLRDWFTVASVIIALAALVISAINYLQGRRRDRRDFFLNSHQALIKPDAAEGRRHLYSINVHLPDDEEAAEKCRDACRRFGSLD